MSAVGFGCQLRTKTALFTIGIRLLTNSETRYIYDGMRVIQERNSGNTPTVIHPGHGPDTTFIMRMGTAT